MEANYQAPKEYEEKVIEVKRVSKKTTGGSSMGFTALVVIGNKRGRVGSALGKANDYASAVQKALQKARRSLIDVNLNNNTISHEVSATFKASEVYLKPAPKGSGIIAGGTVRAVVELAGIRDISGKMLGSNNKAANVICTIEALKKLKVPRKTNGTK
ncbi:MAG TPA: 30S ribosomal protein S5 [Candidatus Saccharimonadales bacterium]|nr:30S ribosomal protein S5 [Candidatus Saccharimonadales bacterium]